MKQTIDEAFRELLDEDQDAEVRRDWIERVLNEVVNALDSIRPDVDIRVQQWPDQVAPTGAVFADVACPPSNLSGRVRILEACWPATTAPSIKVETPLPGNPLPSMTVRVAPGDDGMPDVDAAIRILEALLMDEDWIECVRADVRSKSSTFGWADRLRAKGA